MKENWKRLFSALMALALLVSMLPAASVRAEEAIPEKSVTTEAPRDYAAGGAFSSTISWALSESGVLTLSGTGAMTNDDHAYSSNMPWYSSRNDIKAIVIGEGITAVCNWAFYNYPNVASISFPSTLVTIGDYAFQKLSQVTELNFPQGLTGIGLNAFQYCGVVDLVLPDSLTSLGYGAFAECAAMKTLKLSENLRVIESYTFSGCSSLTSLYIPANVSEINSLAFGDCTSLTSLEFGAMDGTGAQSLYILGEAFLRCDLRRVDLPDNLDLLSGTAFNYNRNLTGVWADNTQREYSLNGPVVGPHFKNDEYGCLYEYEYNSTENVFFKADLLFMPLQFSGSYTVPDSVYRIGTHFTYCTNLTELHYGAGIGSPSSLVHYLGCTSLQKITLGGPPQDKYSESFELDEAGAVIMTNYDGSFITVCFVPVGTTEYTVPAKVTQVAYPAFCNAKLENIFVEEGNTAFTSIDGVLFSADGTKLVSYPTGKTAQSYTIPAEVTLLTTHSFAFCENLTEIHFTGNAPGINYEAFQDVTLTAYYPANNPTWTANKLKDYGGHITWVPESSHTHSYQTIITAPTCTEQGYTTYTCECGDSYTDDYVAALGHDWVLTDSKEPTASEDGYKKYGCSRCDETKTETIPATGEVENPFADVPSGAYFEAPVLWALKQGITGGTSATTFGSTQNCTREQVVMFLWNANGVPEPTLTKSPFTDVPAGKYYTKAVLWAYENGIAGGTSTTTFGVGKDVTRAQFVAFLYNAKGKPEVTGTTSFTDVPANAYYAKPVLWAVQNGITGGTSATTFSPSKACTRAQVVTFLYQAYGKT